MRERRDRTSRTDANARLSHPRCDPGRNARRSNGVRPCPGHPLDHSMSDSAGRSPGSRVDARYAPSQVLRPSGCPTRPSNMHISLSAYSCRDSRGVGRAIRPHRIPQLSLFRGTGAIIRTAAFTAARDPPYRKVPRGPIGFDGRIGAPGGSRTPDRGGRSSLLYPSELRARTGTD